MYTIRTVNGESAPLLFFFHKKWDRDSRQQKKGTRKGGIPVAVKPGVNRDGAPISIFLKRERLRGAAPQEKRS